jgi:hypothetical protein
LRIDLRQPYAEEGGNHAIPIAARWLGSEFKLLRLLNRPTSLRTIYAGAAAQTRLGFGCRISVAVECKLGEVDKWIPSSPCSSYFSASLLGFRTLIAKI